jgi:hypothetical protein
LLEQNHSLGIRREIPLDNITDVSLNSMKVLQHYSLLFGFGLQT